AEDGEAKSVGEDERAELTALRSQSRADAQFATPLDDGERHRAVDAESRENQGCRREGHRELQLELAPSEEEAQVLVDGAGRSEPDLGIERRASRTQSGPEARGRP